MKKHKFLRITLWIWQLPQHLIALIMEKFFDISTERHYKGSVVFLMKKGNFGVCLGKYIFLPESRWLVDELHEYGHHIQSKYFGPLYLLIVGIPSASRNLWDRLFHKKWAWHKRDEWYYGGYPEAWADALGGVCQNKSKDEDFFFRCSCGNKKGVGHNEKHI